MLIRRRDTLRAFGALAVGGASMLAGCSRRDDTAVDFWAMGSEAEIVPKLLPAFRARHPEVQVRVQQMPVTAAHEKLLTAFAGGSLPDMCQLGNTWIPEFSALDALEPLDERITAAGLPREDYFAGILDTNLMPTPQGPRLFGLPWYADTRLLFYRTDLLREAGFPQAPADWKQWRDAMHAISERGGSRHYGALLPLNEPEPLFALALQQGPVLADDDTRGAFSQAPFRRALEFYGSVFRSGEAPAMTNTQISNVYDEFARGLFTFYVSGPWNVGEFRRRLPTAMQDKWATAPLPGPDGPGYSSAGGSSLVLFKRSERKEAAWKLISFLSEPETMQRFHALSGDLPPRRSAWRSPELANDRPSQAFLQQLDRIRPAPKIPEWERILQEMQLMAERVVQRVQGADEATAQLDAWVDDTLEKRRWLRARAKVG